MTHAVLQSPNLEDVQPDQSINPTQDLLLHAVLEGFSDGILVLTPTGAALHINHRGHQLCRQLNDGAKGTAVPPIIWSLCEHLIDSREEFPDQHLVISDTIPGEAGPIRARVQWLQLDFQIETCLLVTLEDQAQSEKSTALYESLLFHLTERETEVWLLKRARLTYEEIAHQLFITTNTVKRHLKSIYAKRKQVLDLAEEG